MRIIVKYLIFLLLFIACTSNDKENKAPNTLLHGDYIGNISVYPCRIRLTDSYVIALEHMMSSNKYFIHVYDKTTNNHLSSFAKKGRGPEEVICISAFDYDKQNNLLWLYDSPNNKLIPFHLDSAINNQQYFPIKENTITLKEQFDFLDQFICVNNNFAIIGGNSSGLIQIINNKGEIINEIGQANKKEEHVKMVHHMNHYLHHFNYCTENRSFVVGYQYYDKIISYNVDGKKEFERGPDKIIPKLLGNGQTHPESKTAFFGFETDHNHIYATYSGEKEVVGNEGNARFRWPRRLYILDWKGNILNTYQFDRPVIDFEIDHVNKKILAIVEPELGESSYLRLYDLPLIN